MSQRRPGTPKQGEDSQKESAEMVLHLGGRLAAQSVPQAFSQLFSALSRHSESAGHRKTGLGCLDHRKSPGRFGEQHAGHSCLVGQKLNCLLPGAVW